MQPIDIDQLLVDAKDGDNSAIGQLLERYRPYLRLMAQRDLDQRMQARLDASDVVQQTFLEAQRDLVGFRGEAEGELIAWLRRILKNNVAEEVDRHLAAQKRSANREQGQAPPGDGAAVPTVERLPADQSSPSQRAMRGEAAIRLAWAIDQLPETQREAIRLRHLEGMALAMISERMEKSEMAVAGLLKRGLKGLREALT
ncbi:MAG: RNA polymerase sigma-70 factor (ECF subfamily) [Pirellulaceae bacterium]|jgi:RNA polymerase sigma-70 factor (ECF subfamily)